MVDTTWTQTAGMTSETATDNIEDFAEQAEASKDAAAASETAAASSASAASTSASEASADAASALSSKNAAATSETNSATSETNSASSAASASTSATNANTSASNSASSASAASTSETNASTSASSAASSASSASSSASAAATSASEAAASAASIDPDNIDINGGTINGTVIGGTTPAAGSFTTGSFTGNVAFGDNDKAIFGAGSDLQIYHDGDHSFIRDGGTGHLKIQGTNLKLQDVDGNNYVDCIDGGYVRLNHNAQTKLETTSTGISVTGNATFADNGKAIFGAGSDLQIYYDTASGDSIIKEDSASGGFKILGANIALRNSDSSKAYIIGADGGAVTAYHNGSAKLATTSTGISVTGNATFADNGKAIFGAGSDLQIYHNGSASYIDDAGSGRLNIRSNDLRIEKYTGETIAKFIADGAVELNYNDVKKLATTSTGVDITGTITSDGLTVDGDAVFTTGDTIRLNTSDGSDNGVLAVAGGGGNSDARGAKVRFYGNEHSSLGGVLDLAAGNVSGGHIYNFTGAKLRQKIDYNGDISFYEDTGTTAKFFWDASAETLRLGSTLPQTPAIFNLRSNGTNIEFGHGNRTSGYFGTLGVSANNGQPYLGFSAHADGGTVNTFTTKGFKGNVIQGDTSGNLTFNQLTNANASGQSLTERMRLTSSGSVGIGTSSPSRKLHVNSGTANEVARFESTDGTAYLSIMDSATSSSLQGIGSAGNALTFYSNNNERMRIDSSGNVGIGTGSPSYELHVADTDSFAVVAIEAANDSFSHIFFGDTDDIDVGRVSYSHSGDFMLFRTNGSERMRIDSSGRVGIGTSSPSSVLHVSSSDPEFILTDTSTNVDHSLDGNSGTGVLRLHVDKNSEGSDPSYIINMAGSEAMRIDSSGRVGIGTSSPSDELEIASSSPAIRLTDTNDSTYGAVSYNVGALFLNGDQTIRFNTDGAEAMRLDSSGNLLVGKTTTGATTAGMAWISNEYLQLVNTETGATERALLINRQSADGTLIEFRKANSTVGSIGVESNAAYFAGVTYGIKPYSAGIAASNSSGVFADGTADLGKDNIRFKDLYLSGGVYLGGTGSANHLDDYETGTFTPTAYGASTAGTTTYATQTGSYTKVGDTVNVDIYISWTAMTGTGNLRIGGLPFTSSSATNYFATGTIVPLLGFTWPSGKTQLNPIMSASDTVMSIYGSATDSNSAAAATDSEIVALAITLTYKV